MKIDINVRSDLEITSRVRQVSSMFDVPLRDSIEHSWSGQIDLDFDWSIGLIVGPSGSGKSTIARDLFGDERRMIWDARSVVDDFDSGLCIQDITSACSSVGFNTIPSWLKPYDVLSNGEKFRVSLARLLAEASAGDTILVDEFTSVVDRQVAHIGCHAVQKHIRRSKKGVRFVAVTCHEDVEDWLRPDWVLRPDDMAFARRSVRPRPPIDVEIAQVSYDAWRLFSGFHYMSRELHRAAQCYGLFVGGQIASFAGVIFFPHPKVKDIVRVSRLVTLPDYQGLGLSFVLVDSLGAAYKSLGLQLRTYPAHPPFVRSFDRSPRWALEQKPGRYSAIPRHQSSLGGFGGRPCAVFSWAGDPMDEQDARRLLHRGTFGR